MENKVKLINGEELSQSEIRVEKIRGELSRFLRLAVGKNENGWYVQTADIFKTQLSDTIKEGMRSFYEAEALAINISHLTDMNVEYWNREDSYKEMVENYNFENWLEIDYQDDNSSDTNLSSASRFYAVFNGEIDKKAILSFYGLLNEGVEVYELQSSEGYIMYEFVKFFRGIKVEDVKDTLFKMKDVVIREKNVTDSHSNTMEYMERLATYKKILEHLKSKDVDYIPQGLSVWDNGAFAVYEALQGYECNGEEFKKGDLYPYSDEGRFFDKDVNSVIISIDEETKTILLQHEFEIVDVLEFGLQGTIDNLNSVLNDIQESKYNLYIDDEKAWNKYEWYLENPTLTQEEVEEIKDVAETLNDLRNKLDYLTTKTSRSHKKIIESFVEGIDDLYDDMYELYDVLNKK